MPNTENRFLSDYPELLAEWDHEKNAGLEPQKIRHRAKIKTWWKCAEGHEWEALVGNRTKGSGCPVCVNGSRTQKRTALLIASAGSLASSNPDLASEWHPTKNGDLTPSSVTPSSNKRVWWLCAEGHEWSAVVSQRNDKGSNCPYCSGRIVISGVNDLAATNPALAAEWHPTLNGWKRPSEVKAGSGKKVWWLCENGHEWEAEVKSRNRGTGCPICNRIKGKTNR